MYFTQLRSFQAVALEGSFTSAAERLNLSQPTITQQVRQLETMFSVELFHRQGRQIEISEVGRALLTDCGQVISRLLYVLCLPVPR